MNTDTGESLHFLDYWQVICARKEIVIAVSVLMVLTGVVVTHSLSRVYGASTVIQVTREIPEVEFFGSGIQRYDPYFLRTQFEIIQSNPVIEEVVQEEGLVEKLGRAYNYFEKLSPEERVARTVRVVSSAMEVQQHRDTDLIAISIRYKQPKGNSTFDASLEAGRTANAVFRVFKSRMLRDRQRRAQEAIAAVEDEIDKQKSKIEEVQQELSDIREEYDIDANAIDATVGQTEGMILQKMRGQLMNAKVELQQKRTLYNEVVKLSPKELSDAVLHVVGDPGGVTVLLQQRREAEVKLATLQAAGLGEQHPQMLQAEALAAELQSKIIESLDGIKTGLRIQYETAKQQYDDLFQIVQELREDEQRRSGTGYKLYREKANFLRQLREREAKLRESNFLEAFKDKAPANSVAQIEQAKLVTSTKAAPISPNFYMNLMLSVVAGLVSGVALAYFVEYLDTSIKTVEDVEQYMDTSVLGIVPQKVKSLNDPAASSGQAESYRVLRTNMKSSAKLEDGKVICMTSGSVGEGKTHTAFNYAYVCADLGDKVLLVDGDMHRPRQHKVLGVDKRPGLANLLMGDVRFDEVVRHNPDDCPFDFLPAGGIDVSVHGLIDSRAMRDMIAEAEEKYDCVIIDAPPMIGVSDTSQLVRIVDGVVMVVQHRKYPRMLSKRAKDMITSLGGNLLGVVLNNINISRDYSSYYYKYHYYYYYSDDGDKKGRRKGSSRKRRSADKESGGSHA